MSPSWSCQEKLREEAKAIDCHWQQTLQRLEYQADRARRRYEQVDPANRLVAQTLETEWHQRLEVLNETQHVYQTQRLSPQAITGTQEQMRAVIAQLRELWYGETITTQEKKALLRCLVEQGFLESHGKVIRARVCW